MPPELGGGAVITVPVRLNGLTPHSAVVLQIALRDEAVPLHRRCDQIGRLAVIELARALIRDAREHGGEIRLLEVDALFQIAEIGVEICLAFEVLLCIFAALCKLFVDFETVARIFDCGRQYLLPFQLAETVLCFPHACHGSWHTRCVIAEKALALDDIALIVEKHVARRSQRCTLAIVDEIGLAVHV